MVGQAAEQIIAGVVLSERLAVTMYGAIHRAQFGGQRNLRGLIVDPTMLKEGTFRIPLTDPGNISTVLKLEHPGIVPTFAVESGGPDVVVVTRGTGRYVTVQDLITSAKAQGKQAGRLAPPVAALIGKSVIEALAAAHRAGVIHGAVHPRSVLVDDEGSVRLGDFVVGRALTTAVAQGADSSLWRGLAGYIAPELVVGEDPTPAVDVYAVGAMMFTMLSGEVPPGSLRVTPAIERLVQRTLDTDPLRRYQTAADLLENLLEAMEDDRWELADRAELIREAGLSRSDTNIDEATEDLLASLGSPTGVQLQPIRPSMDLRAAQVAAKSRGGSSIDDLLNDMGEGSGVTAVDEQVANFTRDPISDLVHGRPSSRVPSLDDPDDDPPPPVRGQTADEAAALAAIGDLDTGAKRVQAPPPRARPAPRVTPIIDPVLDDFKPPSLKSPFKRIVFGVVFLGVLGGLAYLIHTKYNEHEAEQEQAKHSHDDEQRKKDEIEHKLREGLPDPGKIEVTSDGAGVWLRLGRTPLDTQVHLAAGQAHDLVLLHDGNDMTEAQVNGTSWTGADKSLKGAITVALKPNKTKKAPELPLQPTTPELPTTGVAGAGPVHIDSTPSEAEVWLFLGTNHVLFPTWAGRDYELAVVKPGFQTKHVELHAEQWRDGGDPNVPIDAAKKKDVLSTTVDLDPAPKAPKGK